MEKHSRVYAEIDLDAIRYNKIGRASCRERV